MSGRTHRVASRPFPGCRRGRYNAAMQRLAPLLLLLCLPLGCLPEEPGEDERSPPSWQDLPASVAQAFADEAADHEAPGAVLAIRHGEQYYLSGFGSRDPDGGEAIEGTTLFRIGSITKMLTAVAMLQQVDGGLLDLGDSAADHLPPLDLAGPGEFDDITLADLLRHTTGIAEITPIDGGGDDERLHEFTQNDFPSSSYMMNRPGEFWNYSNPNYSLAGLVVERTDGRSYVDVMDRDVFAPLGMDRTWLRPADVLADGDYAIAYGRGWSAGEPGPMRIDADAYDDAWSRPAGWAWSSAPDLVTLGDFLLDGNDDVLPAALHGQMVSPQVATHAFLDHLDYGYGVMQWHGARAGDAWFEVETLEHGGAIPGYAAELITLPEHDMVIATLASTDWALFGATRAVIFEDLLGLTGTDFPDSQVDPSDFQRYVGTYEDPMNIGSVEVSIGGDGGLEVDCPSLDQAGLSYHVSLEPVSLDNFTFTVDNYPIQLTFLAEIGGDQGQAHWFRTRHFVAERSEP